MAAVPTSASAADENQDVIVMLQSSDGIRLPCRAEVAFRSAAVKRRFLEQDIEEDGSILFNNITGQHLVKVLDFCRCVCVSQVVSVCVFVV